MSSPNPSVLRRALTGALLCGVLVAVAAGCGSTAASTGAAAGNGAGPSTSAGPKEIPAGTDKVRSNDGNGYPPADDVAVTGCSASLSGKVSATVHFVNHSPTMADYIVTVAFDGNGGRTQLDTSYATAAAIAAGTEIDGHATTFVDHAPKGLVCKIIEVNRTVHGAA
jgi:hypothetical protein